MSAVIQFSAHDFIAARQYGRPVFLNLHRLDMLKLRRGPKSDEHNAGIGEHMSSALSQFPQAVKELKTNKHIGHIDCKQLLGETKAAVRLCRQIENSELADVSQLESVVNELRGRFQRIACILEWPHVDYVSHEMNYHEREHLKQFTNKRVCLRPCIHMIAHWHRQKESISFSRYAAMWSDAGDVRLGEDVQPMKEHWPLHEPNLIAPGYSELGTAVTQGIIPESHVRT